MKNLVLEMEKFDSDDEDPLQLVPADLRHLVPGFLDRREKEIGELRDLLSRGDFLGIREIGHRLKGTGGGYGFQRMSDLGFEIETAAKQQDFNRIKGSIDELAIMTMNLKGYLHLESKA
jgi:HPt (histidine-containing phosphotransfer) domain-containing protein